MQELINKIMQKAIEISKNTQIKIVIEYSGATESISIYIKAKSEAAVKHFGTIYLDFVNAEEELTEVLQELERIEKTAERRK